MAQNYKLNRGELLKAIEAQRDLMIAVATGGPEIKTVNNDYSQRFSIIHQALTELGLTDHNPLLMFD